jgi:Flp pilus assembly protein TadG
MAGDRHDKRHNIEDGTGATSAMRPITPIWRMLKTIWQDTSGIMLPYVTIMLVVLVGLSLLGIDGARYMSLQTQMQNAADALALAGARELDRRTGSRTRATNAIDNLIANGLSGMGINTPVTRQTIVFYKSLPDASAGWPTAGDVATGDSDAVFVGVTVTPQTVTNVFPVTFLNAAGVNSFTGTAQAIAGNAGEQICKVPPVFICNPWEPTGNTDDAAATTALLNQIQPGSVGVRTQVKVLNDGNTGPGHFGWLVPPDDCKGASCLTEWTSMNSPPACFSAGSVDLNTGAIESAVKAFNLRFGIPNNVNGAGLDATHSPDVNVRKGYVAPSSGGNAGDWCRADADSPASPPVTNNSRAMGPPRDTVFTPLSASGGSIGNGQWDCATYWSFNHQSAPAPTVRADGSSAVCGTPATTTMSRYDVYTYEIKNNLMADPSRGTANTTPPNDYKFSSPYTNQMVETGQPLCAGNTAVAGRRTMQIAVINCEAQAAKITGGATATDIPAAGYATFFLNEPVPTTGTASDRNLIGEMVGFSDLTGAGTGIKATVFRDVQLYR